MIVGYFLAYIPPKRVRPAKSDSCFREYKESWRGQDDISTLTLRVDHLCRQRIDPVIQDTEIKERKFIVINQRSINQERKKETD